MDSPEVDLTSPSSSNGLSRAQKLLTNVMKIFETSRSETASTLNSPLPTSRRQINLSSSSKIRYSQPRLNSIESSRHHHSSSSKVRPSRSHHHDVTRSSRHYHEPTRRSRYSALDDSFLTHKSGSHVGSLDSSVSHELSSSLFEKKEEMALNKFLYQMSTRKNSSERRRSKKESKRLSRDPRMHPSPRLCIHVPTLTHDSTLSNSQHYSRAKVMSSLAKKLDKKHRSRTIEKEEDDKRAACAERTNILSKFASSLQLMKTRLNIFLEGTNISDPSNIDALCEEVMNFKEKTMADKNQCILSLAQSIVHLVLGKLQTQKINGQKAQERFENIFYVPVSKIKMKIVESVNDDDALYHWFRECQLQILYRMETSWLLQGSSDSSDTGEIIDFIKILSSYCHEPKIQDFMSEVLVLGYLETHSDLLVDLYRGINLDPPVHVLANVSPHKEKSIFGSSPGRSSFGGSSASPFGSSDSVFRPPSALKYGSKHGIKRFPTQDSFLSNRSSARYTNHVYVNNPKKMILVPAPKNKTVLIKKPGNTKSPNMFGGNPKGSCKPKTIRRNLFHVDKSNNSSDTKALLSLTSTSLFCRSPSVSSHKSYNKLLSQSPRNRSLRSKRRLDMDSCDDVGVNIGSPDLFSPNPNDRILCPATPSYKPENSCKKLRRSLSYGSSGEKKIILESPEMTKQAYPQSFSQVVHSLSFYSTGGDSFKSRAWEKSGNKMLAAKIKRKVDSSSFMNSGLTLSDLEIIGGCISSPESKSIVSESLPMTSQTPKVSQEIPCCSKSLNDNNNDPNSVQIVQANVNANIEALIRNEQPFAISSSLMKTNIATPTKKITFNFNESLIKTPNRLTSPSTPKSILKTPNRKSPQENSNTSATKSDA